MILLAFICLSYFTFISGEGGNGRWKRSDEEGLANAIDEEIKNMKIEKTEVRLGKDGRMVWEGVEVKDYQAPVSHSLNQGQFKSTRSAVTFEGQADCLTTGLAAWIAPTHAKGPVSAEAKNINLAVTSEGGVVKECKANIGVMKVDLSRLEGAGAPLYQKKEAMVRSAAKKNLEAAICNRAIEAMRKNKV